MATNTFGQDISQAGGSIVPTLQSPSAPSAPDNTMNAAAIQGNQGSTPPVFPSNTPNTSQSVFNANMANASVPTPIPDSASIVAQGAQPNAADQQNSSLKTWLASLVGGQTSQASQQITAEQNAGVPALNQTVSDLNDKLSGINDQITSLGNDTAFNQAHTIPDAAQAGVQGRGVTSGGLAPQLNASQRNYADQQAVKMQQLSAESLSTKALLLGAQSKYSNAKAAADQVGQVLFDQSQQQINYVSALIDANKDQMTKADKAQADLVQAQLADRQTQIDYQKQDITSGLGLISAAMKNIGSLPADQAQAANYAIQQAAGLDKTDPQYLAKVAKLMSPYQTDPLAVQKQLLDLQATRANIAQSQAATAKSYADIKALNNAGSGSSIAQDNLQQTVSGRQYVDGSNLTGKDLAAAQSAAAKAGVPFIDKVDKPFIQNLDITRNNLVTLQQALSNTTIGGNVGQQLSPNTTVGHLWDQFVSFPAQQLFGAGPQHEAISGYDNLKASMISAVKAIGGPGAGARGATLSQQLMQQLPSASDTADDAKIKLDAFSSLLNNAESGILGPQQKSGTLSDGTVVTQNSNGTITDAKGNQYDQNGNRIK